MLNWGLPKIFTTTLYKIENSETNKIGNNDWLPMIRKLNNLPAYISLPSFDISIFMVINVLLDLTTTSYNLLCWYAMYSPQYSLNDATSTV